MTAAKSVSLPSSINCVLARRDPAKLALDLASAQADLYELICALADTRTYKNEKRNVNARRQAKALARRLSRISRRLYTGSCARIRGHDRLGRFVSVHDRDTLDDGGLADIGRSVARLARALSKLRSPEPFAVLVRDGSMPGTACRMSKIGESLQAALFTVVLDLSAADLTGLEPREAGRLSNIIWASGTVWPPTAAERIRTRSRAEPCPGVFPV